MDLVTFTEEILHFLCSVIDFVLSLVFSIKKKDFD